jgi:starch synthase
VPIVTLTGGLADTVKDTTSESISSGEATGFFLRGYAAHHLDAAIGRALWTRYHEPENWKKIVETGMRQDWSWRNSASQYSELYERSIPLIRERA